MTQVYISIKLNDRFFVNNPIYNSDLENNIIEEKQEHECRICLENHGQLISVCGCKGSCEFVHNECIVQWIQQFPKNHDRYKKCEICNSNYNLELLELTNKYNCEKKLIICFVCYLFVLFICFSILLLLWL